MVLSRVNKAGGHKGSPQNKLLELFTFVVQGHQFPKVIRSRLTQSIYFRHTDTWGTSYIICIWHTGYIWNDFQSFFVRKTHVEARTLLLSPKKRFVCRYWHIGWKTNIGHQWIIRNIWIIPWRAPWTSPHPKEPGYFHPLRNRYGWISPIYKA